MSVEVVKSPEIWHRDDFPLIALWRGYGRIIEVGVDRGEYSQVWFNRHWNLRLYVGVDSYAPYPGMPWSRESDFIVGCQRFERCGRVARLLREDSIVAAQTLASSNEPFYRDPYDFVYLDGNHNAEAVYADLKAWWPLVADHGMIAGHDWKAELPGVEQAVTRFADENALTIYHTYEDTPQSWYIYRQGRMPEGSFERVPA